MRVLFITSGPDHAARLLAEAAAAGGHEVRSIDLTRDRLSLRSGPGGSVACNREPVTPDLVVNGSAVTSTGLSPPSALLRQQGTTWFERHLAAREEQGLLAAVLDRFALDGVQVVNPVESADLALMRNLVVERLAARSVLADLTCDSPVETYLVARGRVVLRPGQPIVHTAVPRVCRALADSARLDLGEVDVIRATGRPHAWRLGIDPSRLDDAPARAVSRGVIQALTGELPPATAERSWFFLPDLIENLLRPPRRS